MHIRTAVSNYSHAIDRFQGIIEMQGHTVNTSNSLLCLFICSDSASPSKAAVIWACLLFKPSLARYTHNMLLSLP